MSSRADIRRAMREKQKKKKVYTLTQEQIDEIKDQAVQEAIKGVLKQTIDEVFILLLAIPMEVLITNYWMKSAKKRIPKFIDDVLYLYKAFENDEITIQELEDDLKEFAGITIQQINERRGQVNEGRKQR